MLLSSDISLRQSYAQKTLRKTNILFLFKGNSFRIQMAAGRARNLEQIGVAYLSKKRPSFMNRAPRRSAGVVERGGLENRCGR